MRQQSKPEIIRCLLAAYTSKNREVVEKLLADDFTFTSPYDDRIDKAAYFERCWPNSERMRSVDFENIAETDGQVFVLYKVVTDEGKEFRNTEVFTFHGHRVREISVYFGATYKDGLFVQQQ
jgi:ketosteroid isomerase-like protein